MNTSKDYGPEEFVEKIRNLAYENSKKLKYEIKDSAIKTIRSIEWDLKEDSYSDLEIILSNIGLDKKTCLGQIAQAAAISEQNFKNTPLQYGEVWKDYLVGTILESWNPFRPDITILQNIILCESPRPVLLVSGAQFESYYSLVNQDVHHPRVGKFPLWRGVASAVLVHLSFKYPHPEAKLSFLEKAEETCPGTTLVKENMAGALRLLDKTPEAIKVLEESLEKRLTAQTLFVLYRFTNDNKYRELLTDAYPEEIFKILEQKPSFFAGRRI